MKRMTKGGYNDAMDTSPTNTPESSGSISSSIFDTRLGEERVAARGLSGSSIVIVEPAVDGLDRALKYADATDCRFRKRSGAMTGCMSSSSQGSWITLEGANRRASSVAWEPLRYERTVLLRSRPWRPRGATPQASNVKDGVSMSLSVRVGDSSPTVSAGVAVGDTVDVLPMLSGRSLVEDFGGAR